MKTIQSQTNAILAYMKAGNGITPMEALHLCGCFRLSARIAEIKKLGHAIKTEMVKVEGNKHVARYSLA